MGSIIAGITLTVGLGGLLYMVSSYYMMDKIFEEAGKFMEKNLNKKQSQNPIKENENSKNNEPSFWSKIFCCCKNEDSKNNLDKDEMKINSLIN